MKLDEKVLRNLVVLLHFQSYFSLHPDELASISWKEIIVRFKNSKTVVIKSQWSHPKWFSWVSSKKNDLWSSMSSIFNYQKQNKINGHRFFVVSGYTLWRVNSIKCIINVSLIFCSAQRMWLNLESKATNDSLCLSCFIPILRIFFQYSSVK